jgi:hypothetical protein
LKWSTEFEGEPEKMSENDIVRKSLAEIAREVEPSGSGSEWARVDILTDADIERAVLEDPDAELLDEDWFQRARLVVPGERKLSP